MNLADRMCVPCEGGTPKLDAHQVSEYLAAIPGWTVEDEKLRRSFRFADFVHAMRFLNRVADLAEEQGHHPDFAVHYNRVDFTIYTHAVGGLSENDFILAAKIETLAR